MEKSGNEDFYLTIGVNAKNLELARQIVEKVFNISMIMHESSFLGLYYNFGRIGGKNFKLVQNEEPNSDPGETYFREPEHPQIPYILNLNCIKEIAELPPYKDHPDLIHIKTKVFSDDT